MTKEIGKTLYDTLNSLKGIRKPFVYLLVSDNIEDELVNHGIKLKTSATLQKLYKDLPILGIAIYDAGRRISFSLNKESSFQTMTFERFLAEYQKEKLQMLSRRV